MKKFLTILISVFVALPVLAKGGVDDDVVLTNVNVTRQKTTFNVTYDISVGDDLRSCDIALMISTDAGSTFRPVDRKHLSGDFGRIASSGPKSIQYDFSQDAESLADKQIAFKVEVAGKDVVRRETLISGQVAVYPHLSYGIMGGMVRQWGWYAKGRTDLRFHHSSYEHQSDSPGFWGTGKREVQRFCITAGTMVRAAGWLYPYVGLGYGSYGLYLQDLAGNWAKVTDYCAGGVSIDAGLVLKFGKISLSVGMSNTMFKYTEAEIGFGMMF